MELFAISTLLLLAKHCMLCNYFSLCGSWILDPGLYFDHTNFKSDCNC